MKHPILAMALAVASSFAFTTSSDASSGMASWYGSGHRTANGERFNPNGHTAAHRTIPFGKMVRVFNHRTQRSVIVRINDRGPFVRGRIIDLARGPARAMGMTGTDRVTIQVIGDRRYAEADVD